jgi:2'-5' RNA ligase
VRDVAATEHGSMIDKTPASRFFVALKPDTAAATRLGQLATELARRCGGRPLAAGDLHLTLAFIGERPVGDGQRLLALLDGLPVLTPGLAFDSIGRFEPALLWAGLASTPGFLDDLARQVRRRLIDSSIAFDHRPLHPHLTLVRNARDREAALAAIGPFTAIESTRCTLMLGGTHPAPAPPLRYHWQTPPA